MPSVFFSVKYKARAIAKERSARRIGNEIFGASVEALPKAEFEAWLASKKAAPAAVAAN